LGCSGCGIIPHAAAPNRPAGELAVHPEAPRELTKVILPTYRIEPPDVLQIDAIHVVPKSPYRLRTFDSIVLQVANTLPEAPIAGTFVVEPGGVINLGQPYG